jgi:putative addiction module component (TIGR02574 family)
MHANLEMLELEVLKLAPSERSHLLQRLIASLDPGDDDPTIEAAWELEADRREAEMTTGTVIAVSSEEALQRLRSRLSR